MKDTDLLVLPAITVRQARYLRRKLHEWARQKMKQARRDYGHASYELSPYFEDHVMLEGMAAAIEEMLKDDHIPDPEN